MMITKLASAYIRDVESKLSDNAKHQELRCLLLDLPNDLICKCLETMTAADWLRLWATGNRSLQNKLRQNHIVQNWHVVALRGKRIPATSMKHWVSKFPHILRLNIEGDPNSYGPIVFGDLKDLPRHLKELRFAEPPRHYGKKLLLRDLPITLETLLIDKYEADVKSTNLPNLTQLHVSADLFYPDHYLLFPDSLTHLSLGCPLKTKFVFWPPAGLVRFPPNLLSLTFDTWSHTSPDQSCLPRSLKSLTFNRVDHIRSVNFLDNLPPHLETLRLPLRRRGIPLLNMENLLALPRSLTQLDAENAVQWSESTVSVLPKTLKSLSVNDDDFGSSLIADKFLHLLPPNLTSLKMANASGDTTYSTFDVSQASQLPRTLKTFEYYGIFIHAEQSLAALPRCITELNISLDYSETNSNFLKYLPRRLRSLTLQSKMNDAGIEHLPQTLTRATLTLPTLTYEALQKLPSSLTDLVLTTDKPIFSEFRMSVLPRNLDHLRINEIWKNSSITDHMMEGLPPNLSKLELPFNTKITDQTLATLPRSLTLLNLCRNDNVSDIGIRQLPPALQELHLCGFSKITSAIIPFLPYRGNYPLQFLDNVESQYITQCMRDTEFSKVI
jgi:hypothetical protein